MAWLEESLAQDARAVPAALLAPEPHSAAAGFALVSAANDSIKQGEGREACSQRLLNADVAHALLFTTSPLPHSPCCLPPLPLSLDMPPLSRAASPTGSACSPLASAVLIPVTTEADFIKRRLYPPSTNPPPSSHAAGSACSPLATAVVIPDQRAPPWPQRCVQWCAVLCALEPGNKGRGYRLYVHRVDEPILRLWNTSNVIVYRVQVRAVVCGAVGAGTGIEVKKGGGIMSQPFRAYSQACPEEIPDVGTNIICPLIHVYRSYGVQIVKGYTFGRVDMVRTMHSRIDSMRMTAVSDFARGNGVIRVMLSGYGLLLVRAYVYITNNEIYAPLSTSLHPSRLCFSSTNCLPASDIPVQFGTVGAMFTNDHVHDYVWAAISLHSFPPLSTPPDSSPPASTPLHPYLLLSTTLHPSLSDAYLPVMFQFGVVGAVFKNNHMHTITPSIPHHPSPPVSIHFHLCLTISQARAYLPVLFQLGVVGAVFKNNHVHGYVWATISLCALCAYLPVMFQLGVVGAVFKNNHVHDYVWAAITVCTLPLLATPVHLA
ncbi:unnamed protein product [Closterium sp. Naga37s-1]|nr:unnamed protein product [Closterium sp. Naga37s-1]